MSDVMTRWLVLLSLLVGCHSVALEPDPPATPPPPDTPDAGNVVIPDPTAPQYPDTDVPGTTPLRRLTLLEYRRTLSDLLGPAATGTTAGFTGDFLPTSTAFAMGAWLITSDSVRLFMTEAETVAAAAVTRLETLLPCPVPITPADEDSCAHKFVLTFGRRAYRRPLTTDEANDLVALFHTIRTGGTFADGIRVLVTAFLQSPFFLYHWEVGGYPPIVEGPLVRLSSYQMASRLSYTLWASMPDEALFTAADQNSLADPATIHEQATRMVADARFQGAAVDFVRQWLQLDDTTQLYRSSPAFTPELARSMMAETAAFVAAVVGGSQARLDDLFTSSTFYVDPPLGALYGKPNLPAGDLRPVAMDPAQRVGLLTQGAFLARNAGVDTPNPPQRGKIIARQVLCQPIADEGPDVNFVPLPALPPNPTNRQRYEVHGQLACTAPCHRVLDPAGFAFEEYDAIGAFRATDQGQPVDSTATIPLPGGAMTVKDAPDLIRQLVRRDETLDCLARQWLKYALRRDDALGDRHSLETAGAAFRAASYDIKRLLVALSGTRAFTHRTPSPGEGTP
jgi:hypothetical protein